MKMKRILLAADELKTGLAGRISPLLKHPFYAFATTRVGFCKIQKTWDDESILASTELPGGKRAPINHWHLPIVVELPEYLVRDDVPTYTGKVKT